MAQLPRALLTTTRTPASSSGALPEHGNSSYLGTLHADLGGTLARPSTGGAGAHDEQSLAFALVGANAVDGGDAVRAQAWRGSRLVRERYWLCPGGCQLAYLKGAVDRCPRCRVESSVVRAQAAAVVATRQAEVMEASAYGRGLRFGRDTQQAVGVPVSVGRYFDAEYPSLVQAAVDNVGVDVGVRQRRGWIPEGVKDFDAYLAVVTRGTLKIISRDDVHAFNESGRAVELLTEFDMCMGSVTTLGQQVCTRDWLNARGTRADAFTGGSWSGGAGAYRSSPARAGAAGSTCVREARGGACPSWGMVWRERR